MGNELFHTKVPDLIHMDVACVWMYYCRIEVQ